MSRGSGAQKPSLLLVAADGSRRYLLVAGFLRSEAQLAELGFERHLERLHIGG